MAWKDRFTYMSGLGVEHEVLGQKLRFYPNRIGLLSELAEISKPLSHAFATLFDESPTSNSVSETGTDKDGFEMNRITISPPSPEIAEQRRKERNAAIDEMLEGLSNARLRMMFGKLLMDSLRDEFPYKRDRSPAEVEEFLYGDAERGGLDLPAMTGMVLGWLKANAQVFGKAGEKVVGLVKTKMANLEAMSTLGENSKTPSLPQLDTDSQSSGSSDSI